MENMENKLKIIYGDWTLGVKGQGFSYMFTYAMGGLSSLYAKGKEWIYRAPMPCFWRALTDNDRGNRFQEKSAMWLGADVFIKKTGLRLWVEGREKKDFLPPDNNKLGSQTFAESIRLEFAYETLTVPATECYVTYEIQVDGAMTVTTSYKGKKGLPELPVFGLRMIMPTLAEGFTYEGLSGETYPDRRDGGVPGIYEVEGLPVTPYMLPQECGMHVETKWLEVRRKTSLDNRNLPDRETSLLFEAVDGDFAFSCLPYTAEELESAFHQEDLPVPRRTVVCICGAVRGVGGIDSWGAEPEEAYRIPGDKDLEFSFRIRP
ncbi:MAG: beta-galactosidase small subunit [Eubacterium sp.]|nr:beta-galactosidase small subunit [Eubacterium sp.]